MCILLNCIFFIFLTVHQCCRRAAAATGYRGDYAHCVRHTGLLYTLRYHDDPVRLLQLVRPRLYNPSHFHLHSGMATAVHHLW